MALGSIMEKCRRFSISRIDGKVQISVFFSYFILDVSTKVSFVISPSDSNSLYDLILRMIGVRK